MFAPSYNRMAAASQWQGLRDTGITSHPIQSSYQTFDRPEHILAVAPNEQYVQNTSGEHNLSNHAMYGQAGIPAQIMEYFER